MVYKRRIRGRRRKIEEVDFFLIFVADGERERERI
jgi:hypothetical protein